MSREPDNTEYRPKPYHRPMPILWWLQNPAYITFVVRELTSLFVAFFALVYLWQIRALSQGADAYTQFTERLASPVFVALNAVALIFVLFHAVTWFNLAPTAVIVRLGEKRVPDWVIAGMNYLACVLLSGVVAWILLRG